LTNKNLKLGGEIRSIPSQLLLGKSRVNQYNQRGLLTCKIVQLVKQREVCQISPDITERVKLIENFDICQKKVRIFLVAEQRAATDFLFWTKPDLCNTK